MNHFKKLHKLDLFPITTIEPAQITALIYKHKGESLPPLITYKNPLDLLRDTIRDDGINSGIAALRDALKNSPIYKFWKSSTPFLKDVENIWRYRSPKGRGKPDLLKVNEEILRYGTYLPDNQILYHGRNSKEDRMINTDGPVSTTLMPDVALVHTRARAKEIAILKVKPVSLIKAFVFNNAKNQTHGHECEVLIQNNVKISCKKRETDERTDERKKISIVECEIFI
jgi:hypothetical protein